MADLSKHNKQTNKLSRSFKHRLDKLDCPYTEGVEETWVLELIFKPGEPRIRLLQWLFSKFDSKLGDMLDPHHAFVETKMDSRIQRLLYVSSVLGLCHSDDVDLIRGITTGSKQTYYIDQLLDIVCIKDTAEDTRSKIFQSPGTVSECSSLHEQHVADCSYVDQLVVDEKMAALFNSRVNLIPPDIYKSMEVKRQAKGFSKEKPLIPDINELIDTANNATGQLERQNTILQELIQSYKYSECDTAIMSTTTRTLQVVLSELSQLVASFSYCYENEMRLWCNKTPPILTNLGVAFKRVHNVLQQFMEFLGNIDRIRQSHNSLGQDVNDKIRTKTNLVETGQMALESFQQCVGILDEALQRQEKQH